MQQKKNFAVLLSITKNLAFAAANVIIGIEKHSPGLVDSFIIMHDGLSDNDTEAFSKITNKVFHKQFLLDDFISKLDGKIAAPVQESLKRYTHFNLAKIEFFSFLGTYRNVLYLDSDILIQKDISPIMQFSPLGWRKSFKKNLHQCFMTETTAFKSISTAITIPSGGVIFANEAIQNYEKLTDMAYEFLKNYGHIISTDIGIDEVAIASIAHSNNVEIKLMPWKYNTFPHVKHELPNDAIILHSMSRYKFWNSSLYSILFPEWGDNNKIWESFGGTPYQGKVIQGNDNELYKVKHMISFIAVNHNKISLFEEQLFPNIIKKIKYPIFPSPYGVSEKLILSNAP
jgi:lipopolysaccharide biosynthesis glycosyltransferase